MPRTDLMNLNDAEIVARFNSEIRGMYNYYRIAENVSTLHRYYYMARYSMLKTLAGKHRTNVSEIKRKYLRDGVLAVAYVPEIRREIHHRQPDQGGERRGMRR